MHPLILLQPSDFSKIFSALPAEKCCRYNSRKIFRSLCMTKSFLKNIAVKPNHLAGHLGVSKLFGRKINYIVERKDWAIRWDGLQICENVNHRFPKMAKVTTLPVLKHDSIVHFGSQFLWQEWHKIAKTHNKIVVSFFHELRR